MPVRVALVGTRSGDHRVIVERAADKLNAEGKVVLAEATRHRKCRRKTKIHSAKRILNPANVHERRQGRLGSSKTHTYKAGIKGQEHTGGVGSPERKRVEEVLVEFATPIPQPLPVR